MSEPAPTKTKKASKNKEELASADENKANDKPVEESTEPKEAKDAPEAGAETKPKKKKVVKPKEAASGEEKPAGATEEQPKAEDAGKTGEAAGAAEGEEKKKKVKKVKAKKEGEDSTNPAEGGAAEGQAAAAAGGEEAKKEGEPEKPKKKKKAAAAAEPTEETKAEAPAATGEEEKPKKTKKKKAENTGEAPATGAEPTEQKPEEGAPAGDKPKVKKAAKKEAEVPAEQASPAAAKGKAEPQKPIDLKNAPKTDAKAPGAIDLKAKVEAKPATAGGKNAKAMPEIDLNAAKANPTDATSPNKTVTKGKAGAVASPAEVKAAEVPAKGKVGEQKKEEPVSTARTAQKGAAAIDTKTPTVAKGKGEPDSATKKPVEPAKSEISETSKSVKGRAKSPDASKAIEQRGKRGDDVDKTRMKSFDAGKTEKINPNDSFETRTRIYETRKKERLMEEEKRRIRQETEQCTFAPKLNKKSLSRQLSPGNIYERSVEWTEKVRQNVAAKGEKAFEESRKPEITKNRTKSGADSIFPEERSARLYGVPHGGPQFGVTRTGFVPPTNTSPLEIKHSLDDKINEIHDIYNIVSSNIKAKSHKALARAPILEQPNRRVKQPGSAEKEEISPEPILESEPVPVKTITLKDTSKQENVDRLATLKEVLNLKSGEKKGKKAQQKGQPEKKNEAEPREVFVSEVQNAEEVLKKPTKHLEIRNNRYVMVDNNISSIEKKEDQSMDHSLTLENEIKEIL